MKMAESTVEMTIEEIKVLLAATEIIKKRIEDISSKVEDGFKGRDYFDFDYKKLGANYASILLDIDALREQINEMRSVIKAAMKGSETNDKDAI